MMALKEVREWLKSYGVAEHYYIGKIDNKNEKSIGVYSLERRGTPITAIGGVGCTSYSVKAVSVLVHWTKNAAETEEAAYKLFNSILMERNLDINDKHIYFIRLLVPEPIEVGSDDSGVYERVIEFEIYYKR